MDLGTWKCGEMHDKGHGKETQQRIWQTDMAKKARHRATAR
jgi:hypothetical protein